MTSAKASLDNYAVTSRLNTPCSYQIMLQLKRLTHTIKHLIDGLDPSRSEVINLQSAILLRLDLEKQAKVQISSGEGVVD